MIKIDLSKFDNSWYNPGGSIFKRMLWYFINILFFQCPLNPFIGLKVFLLRLFGARVGKNLCIKPSVNIKYPWRLSIGDNVWIGGNVTILLGVKINQGAIIGAGSVVTHDIPPYVIAAGNPCEVIRSITQEDVHKKW